MKYIKISDLLPLVPLLHTFPVKLQSHQWNVYTTCEMIFCQEGETSIIAPLTGYFSLLGGPCAVTAPLVMPSCIVNVSNCKIFLFEERSVPGIRANVCMREQACPVKLLPFTHLGKHCQERAYGLHKVSQACAVV